MHDTFASMPALPISPTTLAALVVTLSFAAGLNVYATVLSLGVLARLHWIALPDGLHAVADTWIMLASAILFAGEFVADKIPGFDLVWNALQTFVRIPVAALMAYAVGQHLSPEMHVLVTALGAAVATLAHGSKTAMRVAVTPLPEPVSNATLSTAEDGVAIGLTWLVLQHPAVAGISVLLLSVGCVAGIALGFRALGKAFRGVFMDRRKAPR